ncbi:unnamed protein product [Ectocarpus sp. CCAP 1310/34]|nr:unnamed protein product [Ectocarpus sp. CCAP 1310/34]
MNFPPALAPRGPPLPPFHQRSAPHQHLGSARNLAATSIKLYNTPVMSEECCSACRQPTARIDVCCMRERTGGNVRAFVEAAGVADKFPALKCGDPDIDKLVLCKRGGCLFVRPEPAKGEQGA